MKFRNYCVIILSVKQNEMRDSKDEVIRISESKVNFVSGTGIIISTFYSILTINELTDYFKNNGRNFIVFELNKKTYGSYISDEPTYNTLFGNIEKNDEYFLNEISAKLAKDIVSSIKSQNRFNCSGQTISDATIVKEYNVVESIEDYVNSLSEIERKDMINSLIDKGFDNLTEIDKKYLDLLSKK